MANVQPKFKVGEKILLRKDAPPNPWEVGEITKVERGTKGRIGYVIDCASLGGIVSRYEHEIESKFSRH